MMNTDRDNVHKLVIDPVGVYKEFFSRIQKNGQMASFPEFEPVVRFLISELESEYVQKIVKENPVLTFELKEVKTFLFHINLTFELEDEVEYPYAIPFEAPFPYRPTIDAIESAIRFF